MKKKRSKYNSLEIGTVTGLVVPVVSLVFFYLFQKGTLHGLNGFLSELILKDIFTKVISLCAIPNLGVFFLFMRKNYLDSAKGIILATLLFTLIVVFMKFD